jgi:hypothetical protein
MSTYESSFGRETDCLLEGDGFELLVPGRETVKPSWDDCLENGSGSVGEPKFESVFLQL